MSARSAVAEANASTGGVGSATPLHESELGNDFNGNQNGKLKTTKSTGGGASFGKAISSDYREIFFAAHPELRGKVYVHHAVEQQVLQKFPGVVTMEEIHSLENLRGIPLDVNSTVHLSQIRVEWNNFYAPFTERGTAPSQAQLLAKATEIDAKFGLQFTPRVKVK